MGDPGETNRPGETGINDAGYNPSRRYSEQFALPGNQQRCCLRAVCGDGLEGATRRDE